MLAESTSAEFTIDMKCKGRLAMKNTLKIVGAVVLVLVSFVGVVLAYLVYPGTPSRSKFMAFDGFIELPRSGLLNVLDYLSLNDSTLFVTCESSGALFRVDLDPKHLSVSSVSEMPGTGAVHGIPTRSQHRLHHTQRREHGRCLRSQISSTAHEHSGGGRCGCHTLCPVREADVHSEWRREIGDSDRSSEASDCRSHTSPGKARVSCTGPTDRAALSKS